MKNLFKIFTAIFALFCLSAFSYGQAATTATATVGHSVTISVTASGTTPFTYQWAKNGTNISGGTTSTYTIPSVVLTDAATYVATVSNVAGSTVSNNAVLSINQIPTFTTQPVNGSIAYGASYTFTVAVSGIPAPTLQWQLNGTNISGATSATLTISNATTVNSGTYTCVASNSTINGTVTTPNAVSSTSATLTVSAAVAPTITNLSISVN